MHQFRAALRLSCNYGVMKNALVTQLAIRRLIEEGTTVPEGCALEAPLLFTAILGV